ncbi:TIGR02757 family protein [Flexithrix dorotheae]|uniref:TIGR02757 family protein n=1 Tax=Flexithrix dorotheae TaxID=70993 RepID=UPI000368FCA3|nr:TIGR02757 family protein [Flexithrix dorotheae]
MKKSDIKKLLDEKFEEFNQPGFIEDDPICIPHSFTKKQDIEITAFWAATLAWGQRKTIIKSCQNLVKMMDGAPHDFILNHSENDLKSFLNFKHRTFNDIDALYFIEFFKNHYQNHESLEHAFFVEEKPKPENVGNYLIHFHNQFFALPDYPHRTRKHVATPERKSACKRINMFLRWMVRNDKNSVDFGIWKTITPNQLVCPLDIHVERVARKLGLLKRKQTDWLAAVELTQNLKKFDQNDPVKYDFALFGLGLQGF